MRLDLFIDQVRLVRATDREQSEGLLGYVSFRLNHSLLVDAVTLRKTASGRLILSYPTRKSRSGKPYQILRPKDNAVRLAVERQILSKLGLEREGNG